jgi:hypothetical protein
MLSRKFTDYAKHAAAVEQRVMQLLDGALREGGATVDNSQLDLQKSAPTRRGYKSSGRFN